MSHPNKGNLMPVKHIPETIWKKVEKEHVKAIIHTQRHIKESEFIEFVLKRGLASLTSEDFEILKKKAKAGE